MNRWFTIHLWNTQISEISILTETQIVMYIEFHVISAVPYNKQKAMQNKQKLLELQRYPL